jgi:hypothetical protein
MTTGINPDEEDDILEVIRRNAESGGFTVIAPCGCTMGFADAASLMQYGMHVLITGSTHVPDQMAVAPDSHHTH